MTPEEREGLESDAAFLEETAKSFEAVNVRAKDNTAAALSEAARMTQVFTARAMHLHEIAARLRALCVDG